MGTHGSDAQTEMHGRDSLDHITRAARDLLDVWDTRWRVSYPEIDSAIEALRRLVDHGRSD